MPRSQYEGGNSNEELLKTSRDLYELRVATDGKGKELTIRAGKGFAIELQKANRGVEARELLTKLIAMSKQVLGPDHDATKEVASTLKWVAEDSNQG